MPKTQPTEGMSEIIPHDEPLVCFKGFNADWTCRGFKFEVGKTYDYEGKVAVCASGFHACEYPLDVLAYYPPDTSRYAVVEVVGDVARHADDTKIAAARITLTAEIQIGDMVQRAVKWVMDRAKQSGDNMVSGDEEAASATGYSGAASATGDRGVASATGYRGAASATGYRGAASATGYSGAASATGNRGAASATAYRGAASATGDRGAASATGDRGAASATGYRGAASATGYRGAASATGDRGAASATGNRGAASATGYRGAASATGQRSVAIACGYEGRAMAADGCAIFLAERNDHDDIIAVWSGIAGRDGIEAGVWYTLRAGKVEVAS